MSPEKKYKNLSIFFAIVAVVFAVLYFTKDNDESVRGILETVRGDLEVCQQKIVAWQSTHPTSSTEKPSPEDQEELNTILKDCQAAVEANQERF